MKKQTSKFDVILRHVTLGTDPQAVPRQKERPITTTEKSQVVTLLVLS
jgi:hypothetical protein